MSSLGQKQRAHAAIKLEHWPLADQAAWEAASRQSTFLQPGGRASTWRPASRRSVIGAYARLLGWMQVQGIRLEEEAPHARITRERIDEYVAYLQGQCASVTVAGYLAVLCMAVLAMFPDQDWRWLQNLQTRAQRNATPSRHKGDRLVSSELLVQFGMDLINEAESVFNELRQASADPRKLVAAARDFRDGLIIALLGLRPLRVKNLLETEVGVHLRQSAERSSLQFSAEEMKGKRAYHATWPDGLLPALRRYLAEVRGILIRAKAPIDPARPPRPPGATLWLGQGGTPLSAGGLQKLLMRHTRRRFGHVINAHSFRDCVASTLAAQDPDHVRYVADLLGHAELHTAERSYIQPSSRVAFARYHELLANMQKAARQRSRRRMDNTA